MKSQLEVTAPLLIIPLDETGEYSTTLGVKYQEI